MARRATKTTPTRTLEATLWEAADKLRGNLEAAEYKHVVLGLVFLKYVSDAFTARRLELEETLADPASADYIPSEARRTRILESRDEYTSQNVFWIPERARWEHPARQRQAARHRAVPRRGDRPHRAREPEPQGRAPEELRPA